ncbi:MAG: hypothetical protein ACYCXT_02335 [Acidiferrobacteraceae bacterium]
MDRASSRRYRFGMVFSIQRATRWVRGFILATAVASLMLGPGVPADADILMTLAPAGVPGATVAVLDAPGLVASPTPGAPESSWVIGPGNAHSQAMAPLPRRLALFQNVEGSLKLVAAVRVRYFASHGVWVPRYRVSEQMYFVPTDNGWKPLVLHGGVPSMLTYTSTMLPNAEGYYAALTFSSTTGPITIDAWQVYRITSSLSAPYP